MEEQILKILKAGSYELRNTRTGNWLAESYAKEITSMVMEFIGWVRDIPRWLVDSDPVKDSNTLTNTELFEYWKTNIRKP